MKVIQVLAWVLVIGLGASCQLPEEQSDRRDLVQGNLGDLDANPEDVDPTLRLASPELNIQLRQGANNLDWDEVEAAVRYDLLVQPADEDESAEPLRIEGIVRPYTHIKDDAGYYSYALVAVAENRSYDSLPSRFVNDIPTGLIANCLSYQGEAQRSMEAILSSSGLSDCYQFADGAEELTELSLAGFDLIELSPLRHLTGLVQLNLSENLIVDLRPLSELPDLERLNLNSNGVLQDLSPLRDLAKLESLRVSFNAITDLSVVANLPGLKRFEAAGNLLENVSVVASLQQLESLNLANNPVLRTEATCPIVSVNALLAQFCYNGVVVSYQPHIQRLMNLHCVGCHADLGTEAGVIARATEVNTQIQTDQMPMGRAPLSAVDKMIFAQWLASIPQDSDD